MPPRPQGQQMQCGNGPFVLTWGVGAGDICQACYNILSEGETGTQVHECATATRSSSGLPVARQQDMGSSNCLAALPLDSARPAYQSGRGTVQVGSHPSLLRSCSSSLWTRVCHRRRLLHCGADPELPGEAHDLPCLPTTSSGCGTSLRTEPLSAAWRPSVLGCFAWSPGLACRCQLPLHLCSLAAEITAGAEARRSDMGPVPHWFTTRSSSSGDTLCEHTGVACSFDGPCTAMHTKWQGTL